VYLYGEDQLVGCFVFEEGEDFEGSVEISCDAIVHDDELPLGWSDF